MFGNAKVEQDKKIYYPLLASEDLDNGRNSAEEVGAIWAHLVSLAPEKKNILVSDELPEKMKLLQKTFGCSDSTVEGISVLIRWFFFNEVDQTGFREGVQDLFGEQTEKVLTFVQKEIFELKPKMKVEEAEKEDPVQPKIVAEKMPLLQALSKYENLGNQLITNERIKIKSQPEPVRPSLLYWIKYYRDELGIGHHSTVDRGNFLFRSENGKRLTAPERERVNLVLKSVEENYPVDIDTERSEIIFPAFVEPTPRPQPVPQPAPAPVAAPATPRPKPAFNFGQGGMISGAEVKKSVASTPTPGNLSFTSKHVFPAEKPTTPAPTPTPRPMTQSPQPPTNPFRINPVSLGKVKDEE